VNVTLETWEPQEEIHTESDMKPITATDWIFILNSNYKAPLWY